MIEVETNQSFEIIKYLVRLISLKNLYQNLTSFPTLECLIRINLILLTSCNWVLQIQRNFLLFFVKVQNTSLDKSSEKTMMSEKGLLAKQILRLLHVIWLFFLNLMTSVKVDAKYKRFIFERLTALKMVHGILTILKTERVKMALESMYYLKSVNIKVSELSDRLGLAFECLLLLNQE